MNFKRNLKKCRNWIREHRKGLIVGTLVTSAVGVTAAIIRGANNKSKTETQIIEDTTDYGRDCTMKFIVNDTQEVLGEVPCTELYAKEELDIQYKN